ncbi:DUF3224 domain-containing protein, partial [Pseudoalteromonas ruthenica]
MKATGTFTVKINPQQTNATGVDGIDIGRKSKDKTLSREHPGISDGDILSASTPVQD